MTQRLWYTPYGRGLLEALAADNGPALAARATRGSLLSVGRQTATVVFGTGRLPLLVKWRATAPGHGSLACLGASHERREARALLMARIRGLGCPGPMLVAEVRRRASLLGAVSVRPYMEGFRDGAAALAADGGAAVTMLRSLRRWHAAGFRHGDCWPRNILVSDGDVCIPIGCPRGTFVAPGERGDRRRVRDVARLLHGISRLRQDADPDLFLAYAEGSRRLGALRPAVARTVERLRSRSVPARPPSLPACTPPFPDVPLWRGEWRPLHI